MSSSINGKIGLIGDPVAHSLSPAFQQPAFDYYGIPVQYQLWQTVADDIALRIDQMRAGEIFGANVTVPHKERFFEVVDECSPTASRARAINTIVVREGRLIADNTDVHGFIQSLHDQHFDFSSAKVVIIGAGGAARGLVTGLTDRNVQSITIANRTLGRAEDIANAFSDTQILACNLSAAEDHAEDADLLINATAIGWRSDQLPINASIFQTLSPDAIAYDLTYRTTPFLEAAADANVKIIDGLAMLVHQGARSFEIWTGLAAPLDLMMTAARQARDH